MRKLNSKKNILAKVEKTKVTSSMKNAVIKKILHFFGKKIGRGGWQGHHFFLVAIRTSISSEMSSQLSSCTGMALLLAALPNVNVTQENGKVSVQ